MAAVALSYGAAREGRTGQSVDAVTVAGWAGVALGAVLIGWGYAALERARSFSIMPRPLEGGGLVESGPFRFIRHPVYAGLIVGGLGLAAIRPSIATLLGTLALFVILDLKRRREEAWLSTRFAGYGAYRARTHALIPFLY